MPFRRGDTVTLKILDAPIMMVEEIRKDGTVICIWFDITFGCHRDGFEPDLLQEA